MKLKSLPPRLYNVIFHTHTVSGIVIGFGLFICFYAGGFALFLDEVYRWENPLARFETVEEVDYEKVLQAVQESEACFAINESFSIIPPSEHDPLIWFYGARETDKENNTERFTAHVHPVTYEVSTFEEPPTHMARTIYELHFFYQIPYIGIYLAGLVGFFFLFAIITGVLIHWKNIINKFYAFTVEGKWKQIWTNGHTVLGMITMPFQTIYAVTGALLGLSIILLLPTAFLLFDGDTNEVIKAIRPDAAQDYREDAPLVKNPFPFNAVHQQVKSAYPGHEVLVMFARNYAKEDGTINVRIDDHEGIAGDGTFMFQSKDGKLIDEIKPYEKTYAESAFSILIKLHYATYGGIFLKIIYFILAMITCYIISSGVMIWYTARKKATYTEKQKRFHHRVTKTYLALTQSLFPAIALIFIANKLVPMEVENRIFYVNTAFFIGWLLLTCMGLFWNSFRQLNWNYLFIGSVLGLLIPLVNGVVTGDWIWKTWLTGQYYVFSVDLTWIFAGSFALLLCLVILPAARKAKDQAKRSLTKVENTHLGTQTSVA